MRGPALLKCQAFLECPARLADEVRLEGDQLVALGIQKGAVPWSRSRRRSLSAEFVVAVAGADPVTSDSAAGLFGNLPCSGCG